MINKLARRLMLLMARDVMARTHHVSVETYPDDVFVVSYPRSGNTWVRFLLANLIQYETRKPVDFFSVHKVIPGMDKDFHIRTLNKLPPPRLISTHRLYTSGFQRVIYILRDGRDVAVSYYLYMSGKKRFEGSFLDFLTKRDLSPCLWHEHVETWLQHTDHCDLLLVRYESLLASPETELHRMATFAGLPVDEQRLQWSVSSSAFGAMQSLEREKGRLFDSDQELQFVRKGTKGQWRNHFDADHKQVFKSYANSTLLKLGYAESEDW
jgi:estrone sulfotransferase